MSLLMARPLTTKFKDNRTMLHHLAFQALAIAYPSSPKYEHYVAIFADIEVIPPNNSADEPRLLVQVENLFTGPLEKAKKYFKEDKIATAIQLFLEERQKCRAAGLDRIAVFLVVPALETVRLIPIIV